MKKLSAKKYAAAFYQATADMSKTQVDQAAENLVGMLFKNKSLKLADRIIEEFTEYDKQQTGVIDVVVYSARPLDQAAKKSLVEKIKKINRAVKINVNNVVDEGLLGGMVLKIGDQILDASINTCLDDLRQNII
ncbi:MAG: ATP synthase F1 subunit delta [Patescibacteria group bacterium]|jgi:F-type H+-transporting ATPase subunit delta